MLFLDAKRRWRLAAQALRLLTRHPPQRFRFKTRLQRLNSIEASSRAKVNFLEQLYRFHKQQGNPRVSVPTINHKPLDLWLLRKEVHKLGGYEAVWISRALFTRSARSADESCAVFCFRSAMGGGAHRCDWCSWCSADR